MSLIGKVVETKEGKVEILDKIERNNFSLYLVKDTESRLKIIDPDEIVSVSTVQLLGLSLLEEVANNYAPYLYGTDQYGDSYDANEFKREEFLKLLLSKSKIK